jgi:hypothetical protein
MKKDFFHKFVSEGKHNSKYSYGQIVANLTALAAQSKSLEESSEISPDTLQRRLRLGSGLETEWFQDFNSRALELVKLITRRNRRVRWEVLIDETDDPFYGDVRAEKAFIEQNDFPDFLTTYRNHRGATGSFRYLVIALSSKIGTFPVFIMPMIAGADNLPAIERVIATIRKSYSRLTVLADRWFGSGRFIAMLQRLRVGFCVRLKAKGALKDLKRWNRNFIWHSFSWNECEEQKTVHFRVQVYRPHSGGTFLFAVGSRTGTGQWFRHLYKGRWSIENAFKQSDRLQLRTSSRNPMMRLFVFVLALFLFLLFNLKRILEKRWNQSIRSTIFSMFRITIRIDIGT